MTSTLKRTGTLKLPRLKLKEELLKSTPDLAKLLGEEDPNQTQDDLLPSRGGPAGGLDSPRGLEGELTEEEQLKLELEEVKKERAVLMQSLAQVKAGAGSAGGEAQVADIRQLQKELELKKSMLNKLRKDAQLADQRLMSLQNTQEDCKRLMPGEEADDHAQIRALRADMKRLEEELIEAEAKNRLYYLLGERTRRDHMAMEKKVQEAREMKDDCCEDHATLTQHMHDMRAAKEEAEKQLARMRKMYEEAKRDWGKKLADRSWEVRQLEKRQAREREKEDRRRGKAEERERQERETAARIQMEREAYEMQIQSLAPKIEAMEAAWNRLRTISGAETPDDVIAYWEGLKAKEENMRELVKLAEKRESKAKEEIAHLLTARGEMYETGAHREAAASTEDSESRIARSEEAMESTRGKFNKLRSTAIASEQGIAALVARCALALQEISIEAYRPMPSSPYAGANRGKRPTRRSSLTKERGGPVGTIARQGSVMGGVIAEEPSGMDSDPSAAGGGGAGGAAGGGNTIDDDEFFPKLPEELTKLHDKLAQLVEIEKKILAEANLLDGDDGEDKGDDAAGESGAGAGLPPSEKALAKGMARYTWTGAPMLEAVTAHGRALPDYTKTLKRKKGKKKSDMPQPNLARIVGYAGPEIEDDEPPTESDSDSGEEGEWDGIVDREFIKHRAMKMTLKAQAKAKM